MPIPCPKTACLRAPLSVSGRGITWERKEYVVNDRDPWTEHPELFVQVYAMSSSIMSMAVQSSYTCIFTCSCKCWFISKMTQDCFLLLK